MALMSSPLNFLTMVVLPALSKPLEDGKKRRGGGIHVAPNSINKIQQHGMLQTNTGSSYQSGLESDTCLEV